MRRSFSLHRIRKTQDALQFSRIASYIPHPFVHNPISHVKILAHPARFSFSRHLLGNSSHLFTNSSERLAKFSEDIPKRSEDIANFSYLFAKTSASLCKNTKMFPQRHHGVKTKAVQNRPAPPLLYICSRRRALAQIILLLALSFRISCYIWGRF